MSDKTGGPAFEVMLDASDPNFVEQLQAALDMGPDDILEIATPEFDRRDGIVVGYVPRRMDEYTALPTYSEETLLKIGCRKWNIEGDPITWLFPKEWYAYIPAGLLVTDINGEVEAFEPGVTDDDYRGGCLAYGFTAQREKEAG